MKTIDGDEGKKVRDLWVSRESSEQRPNRRDEGKNRDESLWREILGGKQKQWVTSGKISLTSNRILIILLCISDEISLKYIYKSKT